LHAQARTADVDDVFRKYVEIEFWISDDTFGHVAKIPALSARDAVST